MIKNVAEDRGQHIEDMRGAFEHRAAWMYLMYKEAKKRGLSDEFAHNAILECGRYHGENKYTHTDDLHIFHKEFINDNVKGVFQMEDTCTDDKLSVDFHYCPTLTEAKRWALIDEPLLINTDDNVINEMIAKAIYNYSDRRMQDVRIIYMMNIYKELIYSFLFDAYGMLRNMDKATLIMVNPEKIPIRYQDMLAEYLRSGELCVENIVYRPRVRILFCTEANLKKEAEDGHFSRKLLDEIYTKRISSGISIHNNLKMFQRYIRHTVSYYANLYGKAPVNVEPSVLDRIWHEYRNMGMNKMEKIIEQATINGQTNLIQSKKEIDKKGKGETVPLKEIEKKEIQELINCGYNKKEICDVLKISRTTLYRRMQQYGLC